MFARLTTTGIGSMPHTDPDRACDIVLEHVDIPFWPQLPKRSFLELMIPQYAEGLPALRLDVKKNKLWINSSDEEGISSFYEGYGDEIAFPLSRDSAIALYTFLEKIKGRQFPWLKGQVTGPLTFTLGLQDEAGRPVYFNEELREISLMTLAAKVRWQIRQLRSYSDGVIIFIDEPILSAIGTSSYMGVSDEEVKRLLSEIVASIKAEGGISAIHCCGKADWQMVMDTGIDIVNFDAYDYFENFQIYSSELVAFLNRGGHVAWGIVPTDEHINNITVASLKERFDRQIGEVTKKTGLDSIVERLLLTPACGAGSLNEDQALKVFETLKGLKSLLTG